MQEKKFLSFAFCFAFIEKYSILFNNTFGGKKTSDHLNNIYTSNYIVNNTIFSILSIEFYQDKSNLRLISLNFFGPERNDDYETYVNNCKSHNLYVLSYIYYQKKPSDYFRFFKYLLPKIYPIIVIKIKKINAVFISVLIPLSKMNILNKRIAIHKARYTIKRTAINCSDVLIIAGTIDNISQDKKCWFYFNIFGDL